MPRPERPVEGADGVAERFAVELRALRQDAGLPYRNLSARTGYSPSTLSAAAAGHRLPILDVAVAYATACGGDEQEWTAKWQAAALSAATERLDDASATADRAPYRGLTSFTTADADLYFGREDLVAELVTRATSRPVTVVLGASGVGKSSLLAAGVVPALPRDVHAVVTTPCGRLRERLAEELTGHSTCVLVVDQLEEVFTHYPAEERAALVEGLLELADRSDGRVRLLLSVRADFYGRCAEHPRLAAALRNDQVLVAPMTDEELQAAVAGPATAVGLSVERALLAAVVRDARGQAGCRCSRTQCWRPGADAGVTCSRWPASPRPAGSVVRWCRRPRPRTPSSTRPRSG